MHQAASVTYEVQRAVQLALLDLRPMNVAPSLDQIQRFAFANLARAPQVQLAVGSVSPPTAEAAVLGSSQLILALRDHQFETLRSVLLLLQTAVG